MAFIPYLHYAVLGVIFYFGTPLFTSDAKVSVSDTEIIRLISCIIIGARILGDELDYQHGIMAKRSGVTLKSKCSKRSRRSQGRPTALVLPPSPEGRVRFTRPSPRLESVKEEEGEEVMPQLEVPSDHDE